MNKKNNLGLDICFLNEDDPLIVFKQWMSEAEKNETIRYKYSSTSAEKRMLEITKNF